MIVTSEVLSKFIRLKDLDKELLLSTLSSIGLEVEGSYQLEIPKKVVVAKVIKKERHPNADKLNVCEVDIGSEVLQIVCGASNVASNQFVALALEGALLPGLDSKPPLLIKRSEIRGVQSLGMICSSVELGLPKINDGIMELDSSIGELVLGRELCEYDFFNQLVIELGITPNRGDCLSVLGVARDLASVFNLVVHRITTIEPSIALGVGRYLQVSQSSDLESSLMYKIIEIKQAHTPLYIALSLALAGRYRGSFMLDILDYARYMSGVIFNAYPMDSKQVSPNGKEASLAIKRNEAGLESVYAKLKEGEERLLSTIGASLYPTDETHYPRTLIVEASFICPNEISTRLYGQDKSLLDKEIMHASMRGSNPELALGMDLLSDSLNHLGATIYTGTQEVGTGVEPLNIPLTFGYICDCIGNEISREEIALILKRLNFRIQASYDENFFIVQPPSFRHDIKNRQDLVEEVLRLYGVDKVQPRNNNISPTNQKTKAYEKHLKIRDLRKKALAQGYAECLHYVFDDLKRLKELGFESLKPEKELVNPITTELNTLRTSLLPHLLESTYKNKQFGYEGLKLFEIGTVYNSDREPSLRLAFMISDYASQPGYPHPHGVPPSFYDFAQEISNIIGRFECSNISPSLIKNKLLHTYQSGNVVRGGALLGVISRLHPRLEQKYKLNNVFFCEVSADLLLAEEGGHKMAREFSRYQANKRDLSVLVDSKLSFNAIRLEIEKLLSEESIEIVREFYPLDVFVEAGGALHSLSMRFVFQSLTTTLQESQMQEVLDKILARLQVKFAARLKV